MKLVVAPLLVLVASCASSPPPRSSDAPASPSGPASSATAASSPAASGAAGGTPLAGSPSTAPVAEVDPLVGQPAPDFASTAQDGTAVHLASLQGKTVVLYFYPKDETPGCTKEACSFRDSWDAIAKTGATLIGISGDSNDSHKSFAAHYKLPFLLISDPQGTIGQTYGVPFKGHHQRQTFVIGPDGRVRKAYRTVDVTLHAHQILDDLTHPA